MAAPAAEPKVFDLQSARKALPLVRAITRDIVELYRELQERSERLEVIRRNTGGQPGAGGRSRSMPAMFEEEIQEVERGLQRDAVRLQEFLGELLALGVELKDPEKGLVDFPAVVNGEEAYLCWQLGEDTIDHWHLVNEGFAGRQSLAGALVVPVARGVAVPAAPAGSSASASAEEGRSQTDQSASRRPEPGTTDDRS